MTYRFVPHTADIRVSITAPTFRALLEDLTQVLRQLTAGEGPVHARSSREISVQADDAPELVLAVSREILDAFQLDAFVPSRIEIDHLVQPPQPPSVRGRLTGERFDPARHQTQPEIKALTRHGLVAAPADEGWRAELLFDV
jgi:SHS2 domain-containing protein